MSQLQSLLQRFHFVMLLLLFSRIFLLTNLFKNERKQQQLQNKISIRKTRLACTPIACRISIIFFRFFSVIHCLMFQLKAKQKQILKIDSVESEMIAATRDNESTTNSQIKVPTNNVGVERLLRRILTYTFLFTRMIAINGDGYFYFVFLLASISHRYYFLWHN